MRFANLIWGFSRRSHGNMSLSYGDTSESLVNRKNFLAQLGVDYRDLVAAKQVHSSCVRRAREEDRGSGALSYDSSFAGTDALVTDRKNLPLAIFTADCLSVFFFDPKAPAAGIAHAGWRSSKENICAIVLEAMRREFNSQAKDIQVSFGPAIKNCCYEVGEELAGIFPGSTEEKNGRFYLDLARANLKQLLDAGVREGNIFDPAICTFCHKDRSFSFRKDGPSCGRMISVIMLR